MQFEFSKPETVAWKKRAESRHDLEDSLGPCVHFLKERVPRGAEGQGNVMRFREVNFEMVLGREKVDS